jgi:protein involved in polysaccharide export with SLBB domain
MRHNERGSALKAMRKPSTLELISQISARWGERPRACAAEAATSPRRREPSFARKSGGSSVASPHRMAFVRWVLGVGSLSALLLLLSVFPLFAALPVFFDPSAILEPATNAANDTPASSSQAATNTAQTAVTNSMDALDDKHVLAIGDVLSFRIVEDEEERKTLIVTDSGDLEVPYIGRFPADNRTCKQLARELKAALEKEYYYQATVIIAVDSMARSRGKVYLVGPVRMPGPQDIPSDEVLTLSKAILRAGGFTDFADRKNVKVTRQEGGADKQTFVVDVGEIFDNGKTENDLALKPGDLIYIPERMIRF